MAPPTIPEATSLPQPGRKVHQQKGSEIGHLQPGRLRLADVQRILEVLVQRIEQALGQAPDEDAVDRVAERAAKIARPRRVGAQGLRQLATIGISSLPPKYLDDARMAELVGPVTETARAIARELGWCPGGTGAPQR